MRVPNIVPNALFSPAPPSAQVEVVVSKASSALAVQTLDGRLIFHAPVTTGSEHDPLPIGDWTVKGVSRDPVFRYNPELFWDADPSHSKTVIPAGPNNPVGTVWIDISRAHYGIHGTPDAASIGYSASHGCIRMRISDAEWLFQRVDVGTPVFIIAR